MGPRVATATTHTQSFTQPIHPIRILLVCGAVLRLPGTHGPSPVRIARARASSQHVNRDCPQAAPLLVCTIRSLVSEHWRLAALWTASRTSSTSPHHHTPHPVHTLSQLTLWLMSVRDALVPCQSRLLGTENKFNSRLHHVQTPDIDPYPA